MPSKVLVSLARLVGVVGLVSSTLAGCGSAPKGDTQAVQAAEPSPRTVDLFYVTDRDAHPSGRDDFGSERGKVSYGIASVGIPPNHEIGRQEAPSMFRFEWSADELELLRAIADSLGCPLPLVAAAIAVVYALVLGVFVYRDFRIADLPKVILDTVETTGVVMALVMTASLLGYCISVSRLPQEFGGWLTGLTQSPLVYLLIVNVLLLVVGCFMEALAAMLVLIPILVPVAAKLGIDPVHFGIVFVLNLMIGTITPPVGVVLYVTAKVANVPFERMAHAVLPYLVPLFAVLALITVWPAVTTFLPSALLGR